MRRLPIISNRALSTLAFLVASACGSIFSQPQNISFERISVDMGLAQSDVRDITEDKYGFIWFATRDGLSKYDGYSFVNYRNIPGDSSSISNNVINDIETDKEGNLWIATAQGFNLNESSTNQIKQFHFKQGNTQKSNFFTSMIIQNDSAILLGTLDGVLFFNSRDFHFFDTPYEQLKGEEIHDMLYDKGQNLWVTTSTNIIMIDANGTYHKFETYGGKSSTQIRNKIFEDRQGTIWAGQNRGLYRIQPGTQTLEFVHSREDTGYDFSEDGEGNVWVAHHSVSIYKDYILTKNFQHDPTNETSLSKNVAHSIMVSKSGIIWVGTSGYGINKYDPYSQGFQMLKHVPFSPNSLPHDYISGMDNLDEEHILISTPKGLSKFNKITKHIESFDSQNRSDVISVDDKIFTLGYKTLKTIFLKSRKTKTTSVDVSMVSKTPDSNYIWFGGIDTLIRFDKALSRFDRITCPKEFKTAFFTCLFQRDSILWIGTESGIINYKIHSNKFQRSHPELSGLLIKSIFLDSSNQFWISTWGDGLVKWNPEDHSTKFYTTADGLPNNVVYGTLEDEDGNLWMSTNRGLSKFYQTTETFENYSVEDGLPDNEFNSRSFHKDSEGNMYFGGISGLVYFQPAKIRKNIVPPNTVITKLYLNNEEIKPVNSALLKQSIHLTDTLILPWHMNTIGFEYTGINYTSTAKNEYAYYLKGLDQDYNNVGKRRFTNYTNLSPGKYTFKVKSKNNHGIWDKSERQIFVVIKPPFWQTQWFITLAILISITSFYLLIKYRVRKSEKRNVKLQTEVEAQVKASKEREKLINLLEAKNDEMERFNYTVSHDLKSPLITIKGYTGLLREDIELNDTVALIDDIEKIELAATHMNNLLDELLELSRIGRVVNEYAVTHMNDLINEVLKNMKGTLEGIEVKVSSTLPEAYCDSKRISEVFQNLIENAAKFTSNSGNGSITIGGNKKNGWTEFYVRDNGQGIEEKYHQKIFEIFERLDSEVEGTGIGLALAKRIIEVHHGKIWVESNGLGKGSTFYFKLPSKLEDAMSVLPSTI